MFCRHFCVQSGVTCLAQQRNSIDPLVVKSAVLAIMGNETIMISSYRLSRQSRRLLLGVRQDAATSAAVRADIQRATCVQPDRSTSMS